MLENILISIVIPVKNGDCWLNDTIPAILNQQVNGSFEIIVIDSGSTDHTINILQKYPVTLLHIQAEDFNHGTTRNFGVQKAKGKFVVMTVQDAQPVSQFWLQELLDGFIDDTVAGVCGQQVVPHHVEKNPIDWFRPIGLPGKLKYYFSTKSEFESLSPEEKKSICRWDNVTAMYRKDILEKIPFQAASFGEDALWARDTLKAGYSIVYNTAARVNHYHFETRDYAFKRTFTVYYNMYKFFEVKPRVSGKEWKNILSNIKTLFFLKEIKWLAKWKWLKYNYYQRRTIKEAIQVFNSALANDELEKRHSEICVTPPQAVKVQIIE